MNQAEMTPSGRADEEESLAATGINLVTVLIMLAVLVALVAGLFWWLPTWFGSSTITVNVRT